ncbi:MAG: caspase family protein [Armatimonadota bacterium]
MQTLRINTCRTGRLLSFGTVCLAVISSLCATAHAENIALVVGVNQYPGLRPGSNLGGCVNDAKLIGDKLQGYKFNVTLLADDQATKANILSTINGLKAKLKPEDHFALYFAGHGTVASNGESVILTYSSKDANESGDIQNDELYQAVRALPARAKTILLDSCHSGGMVRSVTGLRKSGKFVPRVYVRSQRLKRGVGGDKAWQKVKVNGADDMSDITKNGGVCYFTAALKTQVANETEMEGTRHGVFTFYLASKLTGKKDLWQDVSAAVSTGVLEVTEGEQKPVLAPTGFLSRSVFEGGGTPSPGPGPKPTPNPPSPPTPPSMSLDKLYALSAPDPSRVKLLMTPEMSPVKVGQQVRFRVEAGMDGYLLLIGRDPEGKLEILYPAENQVSAAKVTAGSVVLVPGASDEAMTPDTPGTDGLKAILFTSQEAADAMLKSFGGGAMSLKQADKAWKTVKVKAGPFYTSELITQIVGDQP